MDKGRNCSSLSTIFCYLMLDFYVKIRIRFSLPDKQLFEIIEVEIKIEQPMGRVERSRIQNTVKAVAVM